MLTPEHMQKLAYVAAKRMTPFLLQAAAGWPLPVPEARRGGKQLPVCLDIGRTCPSGIFAFGRRADNRAFWRTGTDNRLLQFE
jgi:hypothetical protein